MVSDLSHTVHAYNCASTSSLACLRTQAHAHASISSVVCLGHPHYGSDFVPQNKRVAFDFDKLKLKVGPLQKTFTIKDKPIDLQCAYCGARLSFLPIFLPSPRRACSAATMLRHGVRNDTCHALGSLSAFAVLHAHPDRISISIVGSFQM